MYFIVESMYPNCIDDPEETLNLYGNLNSMVNGLK